MGEEQTQRVAVYTATLFLFLALAFYAKLDNIHLILNPGLALVCLINFSFRSQLENFTALLLWA